MPIAVKNTKVNQVEIFRRETSAGVFSFSAAVEATKNASTPRTKKASPVTQSRDDAAVKIGRARRLLKSLTTIANHRNKIGYVSKIHMIAEQAAYLFGTIQNEGGKNADLHNFKTWARCLPTIAQSDLIKLYNDAAAVYRAIPTSADIGEAIHLTAFEWFELGRPWGIHPADLSPTEVEEAQKNAKRAKDRARAKARRENKGATPHRMSIRKMCGEYGLSERTFRHRRAEGYDALVLWLKSKLPEEALPQFVACINSIYNQERRKAARSELAFQVSNKCDESVNTPDSRKNLTKRRAAPRPTRQIARAKLFTIAATIFRPANDDGPRNLQRQRSGYQRGGTPHPDGLTTLPADEGSFSRLRA